MRYINLRFTYLLTYLLHSANFKVFPQNQITSKITNSMIIQYRI